MEHSIGTLETLPFEKRCEILEKLGVRDLVRVLGVSSQMRREVLDCLTRLTLGSGEIIPASFVLSLPYVTLVQGTVQVQTLEEVGKITRRIRGPLTIRGGNSTLYADQWTPLDQWLSFFRPQDVFLQLLRIRSFLYPASPFLGLSFVRDFIGHETEELASDDRPVELPIGWDPGTRSLTVHLLIPVLPEDWIQEDDRGNYYDDKYSFILTSLFRTLNPKSLSIALRTGATRNVNVKLNPETIRALGDLALETFAEAFMYQEPCLLSMYIHYRQHLGLPVVLHTIRIIPLDYEITGSNFIRTLIFSVNFDPVPSVTTIEGIPFTPEEQKRLLLPFPNLRFQ